MIVDKITFKQLGSDMSVKELLTLGIQFDQQNRLIPRIGEYVELGRTEYKVIKVTYEYTYDTITITVKKP